MQILTVSQTNEYLRMLLEADPLLEDLWISGEVGSCSRSTAGHTYFVLKDGDSQLRCVLFRGRLSGARVESGMSVILHGRVSLYTATGALQLYVDLVQPEGVGLLHLQFELLRQRLEAQGLFDNARKRPLPQFPKRIGVVTSPTGAVIHDICTVLRRRYPLVELVLAPATVQGDAAAPTIVSAIEVLNFYEIVDIIIVARGGGSFEELWPFNEESVAHAVFGSKVPVVSAIGHETDLTICDLVADVRAPTPSAAAEMVVPDAGELHGRIDLFIRTIEGMIATKLDQERWRLDQLVDLLERAAPDFEARRDALDRIGATLQKSIDQQLALSQELLRGREAHLQALSPLLTLGRGYALLQREDGQILRHVSDVSAGGVIDVSLVDGSFKAGVLEGEGTQHQPSSRVVERAFV